MIGKRRQDEALAHLSRAERASLTVLLGALERAGEALAPSASLQQLKLFLAVAADPRRQVPMRHAGDVASVSTGASLTRNMDALGPGRGRETSGHRVIAISSSTYDARAKDVSLTAKGVAAARVLAAACAPSGKPGAG